MRTRLLRSRTLENSRATGCRNKCAIILSIIELIELSDAPENDLGGFICEKFLKKKPLMDIDQISHKTQEVSFDVVIKKVF